MLVIPCLVWGGFRVRHRRQASAQPAPTPPATLTTGFMLDGPFTHANLTLYVVRGSTRTLASTSRSMRASPRAPSRCGKGSPSGEDRAEVNTLEIENRSDKWLFLQAGDIVKGGKQDRTLTTDLTLAPRSGPQPIEAFCVERGRWTPGGDGLAFRNNPGIVASAPLKRAIQSERSQSRVWQEVAKEEQRAVHAARAAGAPIAAMAPLSNTGTYNAILEDKTVSANRDAYVTALLPHLRKHPNAIGLAIAVNGQVTSADIYGSPALFQRLSRKLLSSYALEGLLARDASLQLKAPTPQQVSAFLAKPATVRAATETVGGSMQRSTRESEEVVMYEYGHSSAKQGMVVVHQSYLKK